ncbi:MAG: hypothetical protein K9N62_04945 [Verrucomicrobia bacterium]|nr:hypothetical protein [Verrucomicrobiota bacterium]
MKRSQGSTSFPVEDYDLEATLTSGQAFRWESCGDAWVAVVGTRWVRLRQSKGGIQAETVGSGGDWKWLSHYLQVDLCLKTVVDTFPDDPALRAAVVACGGLRLLRQDPWECLASFILSSTKRITQIRQIVDRLCRQYGVPATGTPEGVSAFVFPTPARLAQVSEMELRDCRMGFRARYLREAAVRVAEGSIRLDQLHACPVEEARRVLMEIPGVGRKIADCVLLFGFGFQGAFPIDVWIANGLRELYFQNQPVSLRQLLEFSADHFGPFAGYAQQFLFHYLRTGR